MEEDVLPDLNKAVEKMVDILQIDESRIVTSGIGGQRSRRSSGYASASSSPSAVKRATEPHAAVASTSGSHLTVPEDNEDWRISGLYEVTLRWMFDAGSFVEEPDQSFNDKIATNNSVLDDSGTCLLEETNHRPTADSITVTRSSPVETIRIYLHFFCRQKNKLPSFIDFRPIPLLPTDDDDVAAGPERQMYALVFQDGSPAPQTSFPM